MTAIALEYHRWILWIGETTGLTDTVLHIHAGMAVLLLARVVTRQGLGTFVPLAAVVAAEAANELLDRHALGLWDWSATAWDVLNTLLWPTVLSVAIRLRPVAARRRR